MSNQTPTWATSRDAVPEGWTQITVYEESSGERVATVFNEAAACLIEAAPELLEALKQTVSSLEYWFKRNGDPEGANSQMMQNARAAIAKAEEVNQ